MQKSIQQIALKICKKPKDSFSGRQICTFYLTNIIYNDRKNYLFPEELRMCISGLAPRKYIEKKKGGKFSMKINWAHVSKSRFCE